ncbi:MAG: glycosyltransferase family 39 protein [Acidobacteria bacterium]|nr:glycosyltransferase family 39 protein [Acidobacteriota bacterium]
MNPKPYLRAARLLIVVLAAVNIYRAATQSITADEAFTFNRSVLTPLVELWKTYHANDHVLHTLLCKLTVRWFGESEFSLRIPSLLGGVLFLSAALRLCRLLFGDGRSMLAAFLLLALNPFLLDFCSIARGYGMATALLLAAIDQMLRHLESPVALWRLYAAGIGLALAVAANLTILVPGVAAAAVFAALHLGEASNRDQLRARAAHLVDHMAVPAIVIAVALLLMPLLPATRQGFYAGSPTLMDSARNFAYACFWRPRNALEHTALHKPVERIIESLAYVAPPAILLAALWIVFLRRKDKAAVFFAGLLLAVFGLLVWLHHALDVPYPYRRTGLYLAPLVTLFAACLFRAAPKAGVVIATVVLAQFLLSWNVAYYDEWLFDAGNRDLMAYLRDHPPPAGKRVTIGASFALDHGVAFYKHIFRLDWLDPAPRQSGLEGTYDVYLLALEDLAVAEKRGLAIRYQHPISMVSVAVADSASLRP